MLPSLPVWPSLMCWAQGNVVWGTRSRWWHWQGVERSFEPHVCMSLLLRLCPVFCRSCPPGCPRQHSRSGLSLSQKACVRLGNMCPHASQRRDICQLTHLKPMQCSYDSTNFCWAWLGPGLEASCPA